MMYKGYEGIAEFDEDAHIFSGEVLGLKDVITFQGESVSELEQAFHDSVDDYLEWCSEDFVDFLGVGGLFGQVGRHGFGEREQGGGGAAVEVVEGGARQPAHPGALLAGGGFGAQLVELQPEGNGDFLHQVAAALPVAAGAQPAHAPHQRAVAVEEGQVCIVSVHIHLYNTHLLTQI